VIVFYFPLVALPLSLPVLWIDRCCHRVELGWLLQVGCFPKLGQLASPAA